MSKFNPALLAPYFFTTTGIFSVAIGGQTQIARPDSSRILLIVNPAASNFTLFPGLPSASNGGILIQTTSNPFIAKYSDWGGALATGWFIQSGGGVGGVSVIDIAYRPTGD